MKEDATRCLVCGADLTTTEKATQSSKVVEGSRMPSITLSLPAAIGLLALFLGIGAIIVFFALRQQTPEAVVPPTDAPTVTATATATSTATITPFPTSTNTPQPTSTPVTYLVKANDTCLGIAAFFDVSVQSIITLNNLPTACNTLYINQPLQIPQPTPTVTALPSATYSLAEQTEAACEKVEIIVQSTDTLMSISTNYDVPMDAIREENGLSGDTVYLGQPLIIPLCRKFATPGPTPTATLPPPYAAPNLLLPPNGAPFTIADDSITLQWASVGSLQENEAYRVTIEDLTAALGPSLVDQVADTKYIVPSTLRPTDGVLLISSAGSLKLSVFPVRMRVVIRFILQLVLPALPGILAGLVLLVVPHLHHRLTKTAVEISTAVIFFTNLLSRTFIGNFFQHGCRQ